MADLLTPKQAQHILTARELQSSRDAFNVNQTSILENGTDSCWTGSV